MNIQEIFEQTRHVALYQDPKHGFVHVGGFYGERDSECHGEDIRISQPLEVRFVQMPQDELVRTACDALDAAERKVLADMHKQIEEIRERKRSILALTHQAEVVS